MLRYLACCAWWVTTLSATSCGGRWPRSLARVRGLLGVVQCEIAADGEEPVAFGRLVGRQVCGGPQEARRLGRVRSALLRIEATGERFASGRTTDAA